MKIGKHVRYQVEHGPHYSRLSEQLAAMVYWRIHAWVFDPLYRLCVSELSDRLGTYFEERKL